MNHEGKRPANDLHFMIYDSLFDILRFSSLVGTKSVLFKC